MKFSFLRAVGETLRNYYNVRTHILAEPLVSLKIVNGEEAET